MNVSLVLLSPFGVIYEGEVKEVYIPASNGPIGILPRHTPFIGNITSRGGVLHFVDLSNKEHFFAVKNGAIEVKSDKTILLLTEVKEASSYLEAKNILEKDKINGESSLGEKDIKIMEGLSHKKA